MLTNHTPHPSFPRLQLLKRANHCDGVNMADLTHANDMDPTTRTPNRTENIISISAGTQTTSLVPTKAPEQPHFPDERQLLLKIGVWRKEVAVY